MILVLNEWVFHDLLGENGAPAFEETTAFLVAFQRSNDKLIVPAEVRWREKAFRLMQLSDLRGRAISKLFQSLLRDADRSIWIPPGELEIRYRDRIPDQTPPEDVYLVIAYLSGEADLLVTTDQPLFDALWETDAINCLIRDDFMHAYLGAH